MDEKIEIGIEFAKRSIDDDRMLVGGFAYVSKRNGETLTDRQGDSIEAEVMRDAIHEFMKTGRTLGILHTKGADGKSVSGGEIVEAAVFAGDLRPPGMDPTIDAVWLVAKVHDKIAWALVKSRDFRGFSIGGRGVREEMK